LWGGYDATVGTAPDQPATLFVAENDSGEGAQARRCLGAAGVPFVEVTVGSGGGKGKALPDWFRRISENGALPALRIPPSERVLSFGGEAESEMVKFLSRDFEKDGEGGGEKKSKVGAG
jgi:hypothetical protein